MSKYTPGPWKVEQDGKRMLCIRASNGRKPANINGDIGYKKDGNDIEIKANARLIASAPELLEVLKELLIYCRGNMTNQLERLVKQGEQAISKAEEI